MTSRSTRLAQQFQASTKDGVLWFCYNRHLQFCFSVPNRWRCQSLLESWGCCVITLCLSLKESLLHWQHFLLPYFSARSISCTASLVIDSGQSVCLFLSASFYFAFSRFFWYLQISPRKRNSPTKAHLRRSSWFESDFHPPRIRFSCGLLTVSCPIKPSANVSLMNHLVMLNDDCLRERGFACFSIKYHRLLFRKFPGCALLADSSA